MMGPTFLPLAPVEQEAVSLVHRALKEASNEVLVQDLVLLTGPLFRWKRPIVLGEMG